MEITVLFFGQLADATLQQELRINSAEDISSLTKTLHQKFPGLARSAYKIALNKKIINVNAPLVSGDVVALLPPFSGG